MIAALLVLSVACAAFWLVFFRFKLIRLTPGWGIVFAFFVIHLMLVFLIGLRFVTPYSTNAVVVQRTIQLVPRLPEPTLVTAVLVEEDVPVKMGQPLFQFDRRPYEYKVRQISAQLAEAKQNVSVLKLDVEVATQNSNKARIELAYQQYQKRMFDKLAQEQAVREEDVEQMLTQTPNQSMQTSRKVGDAMRGSNATSLADCSRRSDCDLRLKKCLEADQHELHSH